MFEKAIKIILSEPPELHYPAYYADLLKKADVPDKDDGDTISRQAAIDAVNNLTYPSSLEDVKRILVDLPPAQPETHEKRTETHSCDLIDRQALCEYAINQKDKSVTPNDIMRFPSAQPEPHWIPCSERLPENVGVYLVTDHKGDVVRYVFFDSETSKDYWKRCATAWMPIPEPYKGETDV